MDEYTFDTYLLATMTIEADTFEQARARLRGLDEVEFDPPLKLGEHVAMTSIGFRGVAAAWAPAGTPAGQATVIEAHYNHTGFALLERLAMSSPGLRALTNPGRPDRPRH